MNPSDASPETVGGDLLTVLMLFQRKLIRPSAHLTRPSLSHTQIQALGILASFGPLTMSELATALLVSKQQLTPVVDKLDQLGLLNRDSDPSDRRVVRLALSSTGQQFLNEKKTEFIAMVESKIGPLAPQDQASLKAALRLVAELLEKLP